MNFKRIQNKETRLIIAHYVDGKRKTYEQYEAIERKQGIEGKSYSNSLVTTDRKGNNIYTHNYN